MSNSELQQADMVIEKKLKRKDLNAIQKAVVKNDIRDMRVF